MTIKGTATFLIDKVFMNRLISQFTCAPDPVGNRDRLTETRPSFGITAGLNDFANDLLNRLTQATHPTFATENYQYDPVGNRNPASWIYNVGNQLRDDDKGDSDLLD